MGAQALGAGTATLVGLFAGPGLLGHRRAVLVALGAVTALVSLLTLGGKALVSIPAAICLFLLQGETVRGIILLAWCLAFLAVCRCLAPWG